MSSYRQGLETQRDWCTATVVNLNNLCADIKYIARQYHQGIEDLRNAKYLDEFTRLLATRKADFIKYADLLIREVENVHIKYINDRKKTIENTLANLPTNNPRT